MSFSQVIQIIPEADLLWVITATVLVFLMQAGFLALEAGFTRSKNAINVAIKNMADFAISTVVFWTFGFAIMFGPTFAGWFGTGGFALSFDETNAWPTVFFTFQVMFCGTAVTILSGAVAERLRFGAYLFLALWVAGFTYPIFGHWAWAGIDVGESFGWLAKLGFIDFAGSTVVHSVGGWTALAVLLVIGPRIGRFAEDGSPQKIQPSNLPLATLGALLLFVGWLGFNGGSTLGIGPDVGRVIANTVLAGSTGLVAALLLGYWLSGRAHIDYVINGALGGLVAITAGAFAVDSVAAAGIGAIGGIVVVFGLLLLERVRIDDAVGAIPVHLMAGIWGTLAVGIFGELEIMGTGLSRIEQIGVQALGIFVCFLSTFVTTYLLVRAINRVRPLRVPPEAEEVGLNVYEHGATSELADFVDTMETQAETGDLSMRAQVEPYTEVGQIATGYNLLMASLQIKEVEVQDQKEHLEERVEAQTSELRAVNAQIGVALEQLNSTDTIIERWATDGTVLEMNQFGLDVFGFPSEDVIGRPATETFMAGVVGDIEALIANPGESVDSELECRRSDGTSIWVAWRNSPNVDDDGTITDIVSIGIDITERRQMEAQLTAAKERMEEELNIGRDIQMSMVPVDWPAFPERKEFSIYATLQPAREVGGDFYDMFLIDDDHLCFVVADVSDKGVPAALFMAVSKTLIKSHAVADLSPASILTAVNSELAEHNESSMFVTIFLCILEVSTGQLLYTNAGHNPPYIKTSGHGLITLNQRHGPVAGAVDGVAYGENREQLDSGDYVIMFTDGVTEAMSPERELYSEERLEELLEGADLVSTEHAVDLIFDSVVEHADTAEQSDDITILALAFAGIPGEHAHRLDLIIPNRIEEVATVLTGFEEFAASHGLDDSIRRTVLLVLDDLVNNVVSYAFHSAAEHDIEISVELSPHRLAITIADDGIPFNPFGIETPQVDSSLEEREIGGLGIHLVMTLMDEYNYSRRGGKNVVTIVKNLDPEEEGTTDGNHE
jgi:ammonium transporter